MLHVCIGKCCMCALVNVICLHCGRAWGGVGGVYDEEEEELAEGGGEG